MSLEFIRQAKLEDRTTFQIHKAVTEGAPVTEWPDAGVDTLMRECAWADRKTAIRELARAVIASGKSVGQVAHGQLANGNHRITVTLEAAEEQA